MRNPLRFAALLALFVPALSGCSTSSLSLPPQTTRAASIAPAPALNNRSSVQFTFTTLDDYHDPTFNELLGINNEGRMGGYYGSGGSGDPNRGYVVYPPYESGNFKDENFPTSLATQVTSLNNRGMFAGFYVDHKGKTFGFINWNSLWFTYAAPHARDQNPVTELLGINDAGYAVGFYISQYNADVPVKMDIGTGRFHTLNVPGSTDAVATGISGRNHIVGYFTDKSGNVASFLIRPTTGVKTFAFPNGTQTRALGVTTYDRVVGSYVDSAGATHGFYLTKPTTKYPIWQTVDDPNGVGSTVVTGINIHNVLVGYYVDANGSTHGFMAAPNVKR